MTREEAQNRLNKLPQWIPAPCPDCGAKTLKEAEKKCRPMQLACGDYVCATPDNAPDTGGKIHQLNPEYGRWNYAYQSKELRDRQWVRSRKNAL